MDRTLLVIILASMVAGCFPSANPPFREKDLITDQFFEGEWLIAGNSGNGKTFRMSFVREGNHFKDTLRKESEEYYIFTINDSLFFASTTSVDLGKNQKLRIFWTRMMTVSGDKIKIWESEKLSKKFRDMSDDMKLGWLGISSEVARNFIKESTSTFGTFKDLESTAEPTKKSLNDCKLFDMKRRTLDYWVETKMLLDSSTQPQKPNEAQLRNEFFRISEAIKKLPGKGVDLEAVNCRLETVHSMDDAIQYIDKGYRIADIVVGTLTGNPFGAAEATLKEHTDIAQKLYAAKKRTEKTKALLTDKYSAEFP
jgi:hypothetical protein